MSEAPKTIYLQYDQEEVTWCDVLIGAEDIEYVQAAERDALKAELAKLREVIEAALESMDANNKSEAHQILRHAMGTTEQEK